MLKKKWLLSRSDLTLPWRPLFDLVYLYEESSAAVRAMVKVSPNVKAQLKEVIKFARAYFHEDATAEMLKEWMPLLCPVDRYRESHLGWPKKERQRASGQSKQDPL